MKWNHINGCYTDDGGEKSLGQKVKAIRGRNKLDFL